LQLLFLAAVALLAYAPSLTIPLIADDYPNLSQALTYGAPAGFGTLLHDAQFRLRATSYWAMYGLWQVAGLTPPVYHAASLALHIANTWLVFFVAAAWPRMRPAAFWAAAFFAVHEGHQEAVMWFSAINELLMFLFGMASLWCWRSAPDGAKPAWLKELAGVVLFALALLSKESAIFLLPLFVLAVEPGQWRRRLPRLGPHLVLVLLGLASIAQSRSNSFRFTDGSFSLDAPFWIAWPHSLARLLWIWGWPAVLALFVLGDRRFRRSALAALAWIGIALLPYSFLTYSTQIPSRQVYLASAGLAFLVGLALAKYEGRRIAAALLALMLLHNTVYLWTKKRAQFVERAAPTDQLIGFARRTPGAIWIQCFPLPAIVAEEAVRLAIGRSPSDLVWSAGAARERSAAAFCYAGKSSQTLRH
jgi:multisubunit Na+/H+ antiporter MnhB subunit